MKIERIYKHHSWGEAIDLAVNQGNWLPSIDQCRENGLVSTWTSENDPGNVSHAYYIANTGKTISLNKTQMKHFSTVNEKGYSDQDISYRTGDAGHK